MSACLIALLPMLLRAAGEDTPYTPDPNIEQAIEQTAQADKAEALNAIERLAGFGPSAAQALKWHLYNETSPSRRIRWSELLARCGQGRIGYRVTMELQPDGSGVLTLSSDRALLADCARQHARNMRQSEPVYNDEALRWNPYSKVELLKFLPDDVKFLEAHVEPRGEAMDASGMLAFKSFDSLTEFADHFDLGGYQMLSGATLTDNASGVRTLRYKKTEEQDQKRFQDFLLMFHDVKWEFVLDFKGQVLSSNASRREGTKQIWTFNCHQMLTGSAMLEMSYDAMRQSPRPQGTGDKAPASTPAIGAVTAVTGNSDAGNNAPVAIPAQKVIRARVYNLNLTRAEMKTRGKELREKGYVIELDGRQSLPRGTALQYQWLQTSGTDLALSVAALAEPKVGFVIRQPGVYRFELTVSSNGVTSKPSEVKIVVDTDGAGLDAAVPPAEVKSAPTEKPETGAIKSVEKVLPPDTAAIKPPPVEPPPIKPVEPPIEKPVVVVKPIERKVETTQKPAPPPIEEVVQAKPLVKAPPVPEKDPAVTQEVKTVDPVVKAVTPLVKNDPAPVAPPPNTKVKKPDEPAPPEAVKTTDVKPDPDKAKALYADGQKLLKAFKYTEAKTILTQAAALNPNDNDIQFDLAVALMESDNLPEAITKFQAVAVATSNVEAVMNIGHCHSRSGNLREAQTWYQRGASMGGEKVYWESKWQFGNNYIKRKDFETALETLASAEKTAARANVKDPRLLRDMAIALHAAHQDQEAQKRLDDLQGLGYTADPTLVSEVKQGGGKSSVVAAIPPVEKIDTIAKSTPPPIAEIKKDPATQALVENVSKITQAVKNTSKEPEKADPLRTDDPSQIKAAVAAIASNPVTAVKPVEPETKNTATPANNTKNVVNPADPQTTPKQVDPVVVNLTKPVAPKPVPHKKAELPPAKKPLPPIPEDFDTAMTAGKRAYEEGLKFSETKTEDSMQKASDSWNEAEAMYRSAWTAKPGDETVVAAFQELANHIGAIALVKNPVVKAKARGLVVLDAEASIVPKISKEHPLYCVWNQVAGEDLNQRPENLNQKKVGLVIPRPGIYKFELAVSDGIRGGNPVTVTVEVSE